MKICCEKCRKDISGDCFKKVELFETGRTVCPHCHYEQHRYISESDLLLYFGISELIYMLLSYLLFYLTTARGFDVYSIVIIVASFVLYYLVSKYAIFLIYTKGHLKPEVMNKVFEEDAQAIRKDLNWQFMLFFAICFSYLTLSEVRVFFRYTMPIAVAMTFIKYYLQVRNEKKQR